MRHIDADKFMKVLEEDIPITDNPIEVMTSAIAALEEQPTADVRENVKGEWEHGDETARYYLGDACVQIDYAYWRCSACGKVYEQSDKPKYNFCPNCGAQMLRGEA